jgi:hypothetical protein
VTPPPESLKDNGKIFTALLFVGFGSHFGKRRTSHFKVEISKEEKNEIDFLKNVNVLFWMAYN